MDTLKEQRWLCAICSTELDLNRDTHFDHDHSTGLYRGVLCRLCNMGLGFFRDDRGVLFKAIEYVSLWIGTKRSPRFDGKTYIVKRKELL